MEKRLRKHDSENDYKYYVLQIGRKYTYAGYSGLYKPISVSVTPNFFVYNEKFHNLVQNKNNFGEMIQICSKGEHQQRGPNGKTTFLPTCEVQWTADQLRSTTVLDIKDATQDTGMDDTRGAACGTTSADDEGKVATNFPKTTQGENSAEGKTFPIYHYEYKYNQDINLWDKFFEEFCFRIFHNVVKTGNKVKKVIVVLNMFLPTIIKYSLCKCLIEKLEYSSISYINDLVSPLYLCNCKTCVVIDLGYLNCRALPIINGFPLYHHHTYVNNGGFYINEELRRLLKEQYLKANLSNIKNGEREKNYANSNALYNDLHTNCNTDRDQHKEKKECTDETYDLLNSFATMHSLEETLNAIDNMSDEDIENIKVKYCYLKCEKNNYVSDKHILYKLKNCDVVISAETRWKACEILFSKEYDQNIYSLFSTMLDKLTIYESSVFCNILLVGGCSNIKGILSKIAQTFFHVVKEKKKFMNNFENKVHFLFPKISPNLRQFAGASIYSKLDNLPDYGQEQIYSNILYDHLDEDVYMMFKR
ncbi:actin-like protein, putative [Plasmodium ovale]|uniref:Actin-like protein, putative n=2 Tax=Plasmodium ovale TaxID=36330 RepID=A0A1D3KX84_PLAOA|nr:actin-like protein, putative (ALP3) [Plasmodium ovale curtisi]SBS80770.1 actin-like protein, putative (ALP3) [Plasmodium ovale curtisi]SCA48294.1 actin-like protein, putative [Plasmodium ovale]